MMHAQLLPVLAHSVPEQPRAVPEDRSGAVQRRWETLLSRLQTTLGIYWNPAGITQFQTNEVVVAHTAGSSIFSISLSGGVSLVAG